MACVDASTEDEAAVPPYCADIESGWAIVSANNVGIAGYKLWADETLEPCTSKTSKINASVLTSRVKYVASCTLFKCGG